MGPFLFFLGFVTTSCIYLGNGKQSNVKFDWKVRFREQFLAYWLVQMIWEREFRTVFWIGSITASRIAAFIGWMFFLFFFSLQA